MEAGRKGPSTVARRRWDERRSSANRGCQRCPAAPIQLPRLLPLVRPRTAPSQVLMMAGGPLFGRRFRPRASSIRSNSPLMNNCSITYPTVREGKSEESHNRESSRFEMPFQKAWQEQRCTRADDGDMSSGYCKSEIGTCAASVAGLPWWSLGGVEVGGVR